MLGHVSIRCLSQVEHEATGYIQFLRSSEGGAAVMLTGLVAIVYVLALLAGWWTGAYFTVSPVIQAAVLLPFSLLFGTFWLAGYRWLADHTRQPVQIYIALSLLLVLAVAVAHRLNIGQGQILVGPGYAVVVEAVFAMLILWIPVLVYEGLRRNIERFEP